MDEWRAVIAAKLLHSNEVVPIVLVGNKIDKGSAIIRPKDMDAVYPHPITIITLVSISLFFSHHDHIYFHSTFKNVATYVGTSCPPRQAVMPPWR